MIRKTRTNQTRYEANSKLNNYKFYLPSINKNLTGQKKKNNRQEKEKDIKEDSYTKYGTWSDRIGVFVNFIMVVFTIALFSQAVRQNSISKKNIDLADSVFNLSKRQFDSSLASAKEASAYSKQMAALQIKSVESQVASIHTSQQNFEIANQPYLQFAKFSFVNWQPNSSIKFYYVIKNLGAQPAQILEARTFIHVDTSRIASAVRYRPKYYLKKPSRVQYFVSREVDAVLTCESNEIIPKRDYDIINSRKSSFCFFGQIKYINTVTSKKATYEFGIMFESFLINNFNGEFEIIYQIFK